MTKTHLNFIKMKQFIKDPFPEHSLYESLQNSATKLQKFFNMFEEYKPKYVSIHEAYKKGYDKAYKEISDSLPGDN